MPWTQDLSVGVELIDEQHKEWFKKAEAAGVMKAPRYLGIMYENGYGTAVDYSKNIAY